MCIDVDVQWLLMCSCNRTLWVDRKGSLKLWGIAENYIGYDPRVLLRIRWLCQPRTRLIFQGHC